MFAFEIDSIDPTHVLVVLTAVAILYAVCAMYILIRDSHRVNGKGRNYKGTVSQSENKKPIADIMGKSKSVFDKGVSVPQAAVVAETESDAEKDDIFASENVPEHPRQIPPDELDDVFGKPPEGETNEPLGIEQPLYVEPPFPEEFADDDDDENEDLPFRGRHPAHGVKFEELGEAYRRVVHNPTITDTEREETGRILLDLKPTDMFEYIVSGNPKREDTARYFIDTYFAAFQRRVEAETTGSHSPQDDIVAPQGFRVIDNAQP